MSSTTIVRGQLHTDRWAPVADREGVGGVSSLLSTADLQRYEIFEGISDSFLQDLSPDIAVVEWDAGAVLFREGSYLDMAFWIVDGQVALGLESIGSESRPIFGTKMTAVVDSEAARRRTQIRESGADGEDVRLATEDFDLAPDERMELGPGDFFGEIGALNGWPQSVTARTKTPCTVIQIRVPALRKLRRKESDLRKRLDALYRSRTLRRHLAGTPLLKDCPRETIDALAEQVELVSCRPDEPVTQEGEPAEHLIMVRSGFLRLSQQVDAGEMVVSYVSKGGTLGEVELLVDGIDDWQVTANAVGHAELVRIPRREFRRVVGDQPELERRLWEVAVERIRENGYTRHDLRRSDLLEFSLAKGLVQGTSVLVIDLDTCTRCDDCVRGCASTHGGIPRFVREGETYEGMLVARSCYHCEDPVCLIGCPTGAIHRANVGDVVDIDPDLCIGCGACARNCPYDAIVMFDLDEVWPDNAVPKRLRGTPRSLATKCDLCHTSPQGPACVASCPHGCAMRIESVDELDLVLEAKRAGAENAVRAVREAAD